MRLVGCMVMAAVSILGNSIPLAADDTAIIGESGFKVPSWPAGSSIFFADAFADGLQGLPAAVRRNAIPPNSIVSANDGVAWSQLVPADVLENEIKTVINAWHRGEQSPSQVPDPLKKQQYLRYLTLLFSVVARYDGDVRWHADAQRIWYDLLGQFNANTENRLPGRTQDELLSPQLANVTSEPFRQLLHEGRWQAWGTYSPPEPDPWPVTVHRPTVMKRLETADRRVAELVAEGTWSNGHSMARLEHETHVVRLLARLLEAPAAQVATDDEYLSYCRRMAESAEQISGAVQARQFSTAQDAASKLRRTCADCHAAYRD